MIDFLLSTGIRVGELVRLNIDDIDFSERECVVYGKGDKERKAYFDAKTKIHLLNYIESRTDNNIALFVSLNKPHSRLTESGVELRLREMGKKLGVEKVHPHKFRRTMATRAIEKGMPIEQVQKILGHEQIDTALRYAMGQYNRIADEILTLDTFPERFRIMDSESEITVISCYKNLVKPLKTLKFLQGSFFVKCFIV